MKNIPMLAAVALLAACGTIPAPVQQPLMTAPSPITFDGNVAGQASDYVFVLVYDANPKAAGFAMRAGESLRLAMPAAFKRNTSVAVVPDMDTNLVLTKGWPQGSVRLAEQYSVGFDEKTNTMVVTASKDIAGDGMNAPGIKVIHLRGRTFNNPAPGDYPVMVTHAAAGGKALSVWQGSLRVLDAAPGVRLAPTNFHLPPGTNADYQMVDVGKATQHPLGVLLWGAQGAALNGVGIAPRDLARFPRYTGGLLVQDTNQDKLLDPATDKVIGGIIGAAPQGAMGQVATSPMSADGRPVLSGEVLRSSGFPAAAGGGKPNPGLLAIQFKVGDKPGLYRPTVELIGGNNVQFTIEAR